VGFDRARRPVAAAGLFPEEIANAYGLSPAFRGKQVFSWLSRGAKSFLEMSDLSSTDRTRLAGEDLFSSSVAETLEAEDGSVKLKIRLCDQSAIEAVLLSDAEGRLTACLSTQVGCGMACAFCKTGTLGLLRNLGPDEIVEQFHALSALRGKPSNVVFMGMGEPLLNLEAVRKSIAILSHPAGFGISRRKITISTCGIVPGIIDLADNGPHVRLAISLTAADDTLRTRLMPVNKAWNLNSLRDSLKHYQGVTHDRITLEAAIMAGENASVQSALSMADWIGDLDVQVNVIPWNPVPGLSYKEPSSAEVESFTRTLERRGINTVRRARRGRGVSGACGQLGDTLGSSCDVH
jgi:23S rRNA (adenine2503-C2)-methyltransferase